MPGDRDAGASDVGGFDMLPQLEGGVLELALFQQRVQGLRGAGIGGPLAAAARAVVAREGCCGRVLCRAKRAKAKPNMVQKVQNAP